MMAGAKALAWSAVDLLTDAELVAAAKAELASYRSRNYEHPYPVAQ
jgi:hypothetical protein